MTIDDFMKEAAEKLMEIVPADLKDGLTVLPTKVMKMNDQQLNGLILKREGEEAAPTIYIDHLYERHGQGADTKAMMGEVLQIYLDSMVDQPKVVQPDLSFDKVKEHVSMRLVEMKRNRMYLVDVPYMSVGNGFAVVCDIKMDNRDGSWRATITKDMLEKNGYDKRELFTTAMRKSWQLEPPVLSAMSGKLFELTGSNNILKQQDPIPEGSKEQIYVLSNESGVLGASVLFYPGMQEQIAEKLGESFYVLPSSVHEVLIVPESAGLDRAELANMVYTANRTVVEEKDVLSDNVLHYDRDEKKLEPAVHAIGLDEKPREEARC